VESLSFEYGWGHSTDTGVRISDDVESPYRRTSNDSDATLRGSVSLGLYVTMLLWRRCRAATRPG